MVYSYTQVSQYLRCPRSYRYRYLEGWREKETRATMVFGRCFENALGAFFRQEDSAVALFKEWGAFRDAPFEYKKGDSWDRVVHQGVHLLETFARDDRVRIHRPKKNLQIKMLRTLPGGSEFVACTGTGEKAKLRVHEPRGLFWWYGIPTLLRSWPTSPQESSSGNESQKIVMLSFGVAPKLGDKVEIGMKIEPGAKISWGDKPALEPADLTISNLGSDTLAFGDRSFRAQKYGLEVRVAKGDPLSLTIWKDAKGDILAVEDAGTPGFLIALVQYKNYSNPSHANPTPADKQP